MANKAWKKAISVLFFLFSLLGNKAFAKMEAVDPMVVAFCSEWSATGEVSSDTRWDRSLEALQKAFAGPVRPVPLPEDLVACNQAFGEELARARFILSGTSQVRRSLELAQANRVDRDDADVFNFSGVTALKERERRYRDLWDSFVVRLRGGSLAKR